MPLLDGPTLLTLLILAAGSGLFLRVVAKEKHRRERYLQWRLEEKAKELELEAKRGQQEAEAKSRHADQPVQTILPVGEADGNGD